MFKIPKPKKEMSIKPKRPFGLHAAFGSGPKQAFRDPKSMASPDQAFTAAMAQPQDAASVPAPALPPNPQG